MPNALPESKIVMLEQCMESGMSEHAAAKQCEVSRASVHRYKPRRPTPTRLPKLIDKVRKELGDRMLVKCDEMIRYMTPQKMKRASLSQLSMAASGLYANYRLSQGQSTSNVAVLNAILSRVHRDLK